MSDMGVASMTRVNRARTAATGRESMQIHVNGKQIDIGTSLQDHAESRLTDAASKYAGRPTEGTITFSRDAHEYVCDCSVHLSTGMNALSKGRGTDIYESLERAVDRLEKQLRRYKRRLKDHHQKRENPIEVVGASAYILSADEEDRAEADEPESLQPVIVAEMETKVQSLSVGEAVMQMELAGAPLLVFRNDAHGGVNVVYKRDDGNIGWVDPRNMAQS